MENVGAVAVPISGLSRTAEPGRSTLAGTAGSCRGYSLSELVVVIAIIGIMGAAAVPWLLSALPGATVTWGAREIQGSLMRAKMLAASTRQAICVKVVSGGYRLWQGGAAGTGGAGSGTASRGACRPLPVRFTVTSGGRAP